jgi:hypothetical protein
LLKDPNPETWWWSAGSSRERLTYQCSLDETLGLAYHALDAKARYVLRISGFGDIKAFANGQPLDASRYGKELGEFKEYPVPQALCADGNLKITWVCEKYPNTNWRQQPRVSEVWLLKQ